MAENAYTVTIIASSDEEARRNAEVAEKRDGFNVNATSVWDGPIPENSFFYITPFVRSSTPEYMFYRAANQRDEHETMMLLAELVGPYTTSIINPNIAEDEMWLNDDAHTTPLDIAAYLIDAIEYDEAKKALDVLRKFLEDMPEYVGEYIGLISHKRIVERP